MRLLLKTADLSQAMAGVISGGDREKAAGFLRLRDPGEPTDAQKKAGNYAKRKLTWRGLTISVENEAGDMRRGVGTDGEWSTRMHYAYGYVNRTMGVDGDQVDVYLGPELEAADTVYIVHQRRYGDWSEYDEDKCMLGFPSEEAARDAYLSCYDDPRFLGPITAMPVEEFVAKVQATKEEASMIKSLGQRVVLLLKNRVGPHVRGGRLVAGYERHDARQPNLFGEDMPEQRAPPRMVLPTKGAPVTHEAMEPDANHVKDDGIVWDRVPEKRKRLHLLDHPSGQTAIAYEGEDGKLYGARTVARGTEGHDKVVHAWKEDAARQGMDIVDKRTAGPGRSRKFYATMVKEGAPATAGNVAYLAGPFDDHEEAKKHVQRSREIATNMDGRHHWNSFGTGSIETVDGQHPKGKLNSHLGVG